jgi:hypothetical protein
MSKRELSKPYPGDGGAAKTATFDGIQGTTISPDGAIIIADRGNFGVRKIKIQAELITLAANQPQGHQKCWPEL